LEEIAAFSRRNRIRKLALFGSVLCDDFTPDSDVDVLVEFEPGTRVGLRFFALEQELAELLGRTVDLNTPGFLSKYFRDQVMAEAEQLYVAPRRPDAVAPHAGVCARGASHGPRPTPRRSRCGSHAGASPHPFA
jgi:hypothetical protein